MNELDAYAQRVVDRKIPAGKYHRLSCERHIRDRSRENTPGFQYRFDIDRAERFFKFSRQLKHYKGEWAGQHIELRDYQKFRLGSIFGWVHAQTGLRRFRSSYHEIPRKNGKTLEAAIVMLYLTFFDGEPGAEGYTIATKRDQAKLVHTDCKKLVLSSGLKDRLEVRVANISRDSTASKLEPLGADHDSTDGLNPSAVCADELHAYKNRGLIDVMETATGARRQPHFLKITTAGDDPVSVGGDEHNYACEVLDGVREDETYFAFIAHADPDDDWLSEDTWRKANPNYGFSVKPEDLAALAQKAKGIPAAAATFKQKRLNLWVNATAPCLSVEGWAKGQRTKTRDALIESLKGQPCFAGVDLASKIDLMALSLLFPPFEERKHWAVIQHLWTPEDTLADRSHRDRAPYDLWVDMGWLQTTPGVQLDHAVIPEVLLEARSLFQLEGVGYDPWHFAQVLKDLTTVHGFAEERVLAIPQTFAGMSSACLQIQADILEAAIDAAGCPVTAWCVSNTAGDSDGKNNLLFIKKKSRGRIDPVVSMTIAKAFWIRREQPEVEPEPIMFFVGGKR